MNKKKIIEYLKQQINECKKILERTQDRALKAYYQGQIYAFELTLREVENEKNPDIQEPNALDDLLKATGCESVDDVKARFFYMKDLIEEECMADSDTFDDLDDDAAEEAE